MTFYTSNYLPHFTEYEKTKELTQRYHREARTWKFSQNYLEIFQKSTESRIACMLANCENSMIAHAALIRIGECPSIAPFLENNGPRPRKGPRSIVFKEWNDTRRFAYVKSTQQLQPLPRYNLLSYIINYSVHVSIHIIYTLYTSLSCSYIF